MRKTHLAVAAATALFFSLLPSAQGQELKTGYFLDYNIYGSNLNPAIQPERTKFFLGLAVGDVNVRASSNVGVSSLFFPYDGQLVSGLNENIPASTFLGGLPALSKINADVSENVLGFGFRSKEGRAFTTIKLNIKSSNGVTVPKSAFECLKEENESGKYVFNDISLYSRNYAELAISQSRQIGERLTVGVALKGLMGIADARLDMTQMTVDNSGDDTSVSGSGTIRAAVPYVTFRADGNGHLDLETIDPDEKFTPKSGGFGLAADLGAVFEPFEGFSVSAALTDLGFIAWKQNLSGSLEGGIYADTDDIANDVAKLFKIDTASGSYLSMLNTQANIGVKYRFPFAHCLSVGALYSTRLGSTVAKYNDLRAGITFTPGRMLSIAGSAGVSSVGMSAGAAMNLKLGILNVFAGVDGIFTQLTAQYLPVDPVSTVAKVGVSMVIGAKKGE